MIILKATTLVILNTIAASTTAWCIYRVTKGTLAGINSADLPYFLVSASLTAFIGSLLFIRWLLRCSMQENKVVRWIGVCLLNVGVVLITHIGAGITLASRSFWRYHQKSYSSSCFDFQRPWLLSRSLGHNKSLQQNVLIWL